MDTTEFYERMRNINLEVSDVIYTMQIYDASVWLCKHYDIEPPLDTANVEEDLSRIHEGILKTLSSDELSLFRDIDECITGIQ